MHINRTVRLVCRYVLHEMRRRLLFFQLSANFHSTTDIRVKCDNIFFRFANELPFVGTSFRYVSSTCLGIRAILNTSISIVFRFSFYEEFIKKNHTGNCAVEKFIHFMLNSLLIESQLIIIERIHCRLMRV